MSDYRPEDDGMMPVMLPSGGSFSVYKTEVQYFNDRRSKYLSDNHFTNISDLQDLDRLLVSELLVQRWQTWLSGKRDYWGDPIDENVWQKAVKEHAAEVRQLKKALGLDKESRDKQKGEGSVVHYLEGLRERAGHFMYMRNEQFFKQIELFQELKSLVALHLNCTEEERVEQKITKDDLLDWIINTAIPEFDKIDEEFRKTKQTFWIREQ